MSIFYNIVAQIGGAIYYGVKAGVQMQFLRSLIKAVSGI